MVSAATNGILTGMTSIEARQIGAVAEHLRALHAPRPGTRVDLVLSIASTADGDGERDEIQIEFEIEIED